MKMFLAFSFSSPVAPVLVRRAARRLTRHVPDAFAAVPVIWIAADRRKAILHWARRDEPAPERLVADPVSATVLDGYLGSRAPGRTMAQTLAGRLSQGRITGSGGAGGLAALAHADARGIEGWTTQPPGQGLWYAQGHLPAREDEPAAPLSAVAGTRPLLVHLAFRSDDRPEMSEEALAMRLTAGSILDHGNLLAGVRRLWPTNRLRLVDGVASEYPDTLPPAPAFASDNSAETRAEALAEALVAAVASARSGAMLLASGGKDSRTIAAACHAAGHDIAFTTNGATDAEEPTIAAAALAGIGASLDIRRQRVHADVVEGTRLTLLRSDGQISSDARQLPFAAMPAYDRPVLHGHGHLLRGGSAAHPEYAGLPGKASFWRTGDRRLPDFQKTLEAPFTSGWVTDSLNDAARAVLARWREGRPVRDPREWLWYAHHDLRLGVHTAAGILDYGGINRMIYPLMDENLIALAARLPFEERVDESALFRAIRHLAPALARAPLFGEMWRFEAEAAVPGFDGRQDRIAPYDKNHFRGSGGGVEWIGDPPKHPRPRLMAQTLKDARVWPVLRGFMQPRMIAVVETQAARGKLPDEELARPKPSQDSALRKLAEAFGLALAFDGGWFAPLRSAPPLAAFTKTEQFGSAA